MTKTDWSARCKSCGAPIIWCTTTSGKKMPVDAETSAEGNIWVASDYTASVLSRSEIERAFTPEERANELRHSHFTTCKDAAKFRRPRS